jgi:hypothetical protein
MEKELLHRCKDTGIGNVFFLKAGPGLAFVFWCEDLLLFYTFFMPKYPSKPKG